MLDDKTLISLMDLTDLSESVTDAGTDALCARAQTPHGPVAAVCVWPQMVSRAKAHLMGTGIHVVSVANFPKGDEDIERVVDDVSEALRDGADEIDLVLPYRALMRGDETAITDMMLAIRDIVDQRRVLKAILETGALKEEGLIRRASELALAGGADFLKTSTGKTGEGATLDAARIMLDVLSTSNAKAGIKISSGLRTKEQAGAYIDLAQSIMGADWVCAKTFRLGTSQFLT
jgi:deoxyribose-phosphate aldolase